MTAPPAAAAAAAVTIADLCDLAKSLTESGERRILGLIGAPAAGKSTLSEALQLTLGSRAAVVGMDGFHLSGSELRRLGRHLRKGAPDTFDVSGYVNLLHRLRRRDESIVYAPAFDRNIEESIAGAVPIGRDVPLVITEGNYLLLGTHGWDEVAPLLDETWYLDVSVDALRDRLLRRRVGHGHDPVEAAVWVRTVDEPNMRIVQDTRVRADRVVTLANDERN